jgi:tripartite-type tricarboxylate transporter receptor subunit TctC
MKKLFATFLILLASLANAQVIEVVVSASAGGPNDTVTRKIVEKLEKETNLQFIVLNKPGAGHTIAYSYVQSATKPVIIFETPTIQQHEVFTHVDDIFTTGYFYNTVVVAKSSGIKNINDLMELNTKRDINFGHGGVGSFSHMAAKKICEKTLKCLDVPYKSAAEGMMGLLSGTIDAYAIVSYGSRKFLENEKYIGIHNIKLGKEKSWYKLFGKNLSDKEKQLIADVLRKTETNFFADLGLEK